MALLWTDNLLCSSPGNSIPLVTVLFTQIIQSLKLRAQLLMMSQTNTHVTIKVKLSTIHNFPMLGTISLCPLFFMQKLQSKESRVCSVGLPEQLSDPSRLSYVEVLEGILST
jgi:hypothetical protein